MTHLPALARVALWSLTISVFIGPIATIAAQEPASSKPQLFAEGIV